MTASTVKFCGRRYCACGCGEINPQPPTGRPRQYLEGHYTRPPRRARPSCAWCGGKLQRGRRRYCSRPCSKSGRQYRQTRRKQEERGKRIGGLLAALALIGARRVPLITGVA